MIAKVRRFATLTFMSEAADIPRGSEEDDARAVEGAANFLEGGVRLRLGLGRAADDERALADRALARRADDAHELAEELERDRQQRRLDVGRRDVRALR